MISLLLLGTAKQSALAIASRKAIAVNELGLSVMGLGLLVGKKTKFFQPANTKA